MTIRSIDMQVLIPKVSDVGKIQQIQLQENASRQQENANLIARQTLKNTTTVNQPLRDEAALIHEKEEQEKKSRKKKGKKGKSDNKQNTKNSIDIKNVDPQRGSNIDIKI